MVYLLLCSPSLLNSGRRKKVLDFVLFFLFTFIDLVKDASSVVDVVEIEQDVDHETNDCKHAEIDVVPEVTTLLFGAE